MSRLRPSLGIIAIAALLISCGSPDQQEQGLTSPAQVRVNAASQLVTMDVKNASIAAVLADIGQQAQIMISPSGMIIPERLSLSLQNMPLEDALKRVLAGQSYIISYKQEQGREVIAGIRLLANSAGVPVAASASSTMPARTRLMGSQSPPQAPVRSWGRGRAQTNESRGALIRDEGSLDDLKRSFSETQDPARRSAILDVMANRGEEGRVAPALSMALSDSDEEVRADALNLLKSASEPLSLGPLMQMTAADNNPDLRMDAMTLMAEQLYSEERPKEEWAAVQASLNRSLSDPSPEVREQAEMLLSDLSQSAQPTGKRAFR